MISPFEFILLLLASFRLAHLIVLDEIMAPLRKPFHKITTETLPDGTTASFLEVKGNGIRKFIGELIACYWCTGIWTAAFLYFGFIFYPIIFLPVVIIFAIAGAGSVIEAIVQKIIHS
ncbi:DUF1360 domain-containing protein [Alkalihalobacterium elongatum]|uniref:DUF1360 domain-containing protein n=1 Tax=Alkalihalobacterium elongatum TaxID=2675466 RepID=UPI001C1F4DE3|nr:DUF1360 domain-containing protein [Alkalihalobacterium elongatum]